MNLFEALKSEHRALSDILARVHATSDRARRSRRELFEKARAAFESHAGAQELLLYPALRDRTQVRGERRLADLREERLLEQRLVETKEERALVRRLFEELNQVDARDPRWMARFTILRQNIERHLAQDERDLFPVARKLLDRAVQVDLGRRASASGARALHDFATASGGREVVASLWV